MAEPLGHWRDRARTNWLVGADAQQSGEWTEIHWQEILDYRQRSNYLPTVLLVEPDSWRFLAGFVAACSAGCPLVLGSANWAEPERQQVLEQVQPDLVWGSESWMVPAIRQQRFDCARPQPGWILIPTGGSSGQIRFAVHTWSTLTAAVLGFQHYFQVERVHSCCVLPLYHVSGLMQFMRSFLSGGQLAILPPQAIEAAMNQLNPSDFFLSLVPTQLHRLLHHSDSSRAIEWLRGFRTVLLGGAPAWPKLLETARTHQIRLAPTYGMTETAAQVATLKPEEFLQGQTGCGQVLPHAQLTIVDAAGQTLSSNQVGTIAIQSTSLALGYYPDLWHDSTWQTDDLGYFDAAGYLHLVGRNSSKIITGGEKVFPTEVEAAIRATQLVHDVCVVGLPDREWGEVVTAAYVPVSTEVTIAALQAAVAPLLSSIKRPKRWIALEQLPRNGQGKLNYEQLKQQVGQKVEEGRGQKAEGKGQKNDG
jgi:o-succinylbenzoate---CoA ligase